MKTAKQTAKFPKTKPTKTVKKPSKILVKADSNDTLNEEPLKQPSAFFLKVLDANATKIQRWFRALKQKKQNLDPVLARRLERAKQTREVLLLT